MHSLLLFIVAFWTAYVAAQQSWPQYPFSTLKTSLGPSEQPFTTGWIQLLQQFYDTFGYMHGSQHESCRFPVPTFDCPPFVWEDAIVDRDSHHLRPQDIKAVIALGDSISAGFGMLSGRPPLASILEYRGKAFSSGADPGEYTVANFLSLYADAHGAATGVTLPLSRGKQLNNAVSGSKTQDLDAQVSRLVRVLDSKRYRLLKNEWKLITLFVGANNICVLCTPPATRLPSLAEAAVFEENVRGALERLQREVGKAFVNVIGLFNVSSVYDASRGDPYCEFVLDPAHMAICSCVQGNKEQRQAADLVVSEYNQRLQRLARRFDSKDFAVAYQPGFSMFPIAKYKQSYFSGIDCFHPNKCANQVMAIVLWNNMFATEQEKWTPYDLGNLTIQCPGPERPYLRS